MIKDELKLFELNVSSLSTFVTSKKEKMKEEASNEGCNEDTLRDLKIVININ